jgi:sporulation protein YlmC with PRC-barrel domain
MAYPNLAPGARLLKVTLRNRNGEVIGEVREWLMDIDEGRVVYVLASLKQTEDKYVALPWKLMKADKEKGGYRVDAEVEELKNAPQIHSEKLDDTVGDKNFLDEVFSHFNAEKYWAQKSGSQDRPAASRDASSKEKEGTENVARSEGKGYGDVPGK